MVTTASKQMIFSDNNHWQFGWGRRKNRYNFDEQGHPLWVTFGPCASQPKSFDIEMAVAAKKIANAATKPIYVAMSGGIDSELVARTMVQEKIPFTPLILKYDNDVNKMDIAYAFEFCKQHNLTPEVPTLDIVSFFQGSVETPYILANCAHIMHMHLMRYAASKGGMAVIAVGEQRYERIDGKIVIPVPIERIAVTHFMQAEQVEGVSAFYCYTPELMLSILLEAKAHGFENMDKFAHNIKDTLYHKFWPDLTHRPKYSGFENVEQERLKAQRILRKKYGSKVAKYTIPIFEFEHQLNGGANAFSIKY